MLEFFFITAGVSFVLAIVAIIPMLTTRRRWLATVLFLIGVTSLFAGIYRLQTRDEVTPTNIESHVASWLKSFEVKTQPATDPGIYWGVKVIYDDSTETGVSRVKSLDHYITFGNQVAFSKDHIDTLNRFSEDQRRRFWIDLTTEIYKARINGQTTIANPETPIRIIRLLPITPQLTEAAFMSELDQAHADERIVIGTINQLIYRYGHEATQPSPIPHKGASPH